MANKEKWQGVAKVSWGTLVVGFLLAGAAAVTESRHLAVVGVVDLAVSWVVFVWSVVKVGQLK